MFHTAVRSPWQSLYDNHRCIVLVCSSGSTTWRAILYIICIILWTHIIHSADSNWTKSHRAWFTLFTSYLPLPMRCGTYSTLTQYLLWGMQYMTSKSFQVHTFMQLVMHSMYVCNTSVIYVCVSVCFCVLCCCILFCCVLLLWFMHCRSLLATQLGDCGDWRKGTMTRCLYLQSML